MAILKKPPESVGRSLRVEQPARDLSGDYSRFVDGTPDYVASFALRKMLASDPAYKKGNAAQNGANAARGGVSLQHRRKRS